MTGSATPPPTGALRRWVASPEHSPDWEERKERILPQPPPPPPPPPITADSSAGEKFEVLPEERGSGDRGQAGRVIGEEKTVLVTPASKYATKGQTTLLNI